MHSGWGFAPDPTGGAYSALAVPLAGFQGIHFAAGRGRDERGGQGRRERKGEGRGRERPRSFFLQFNHWTETV